MTKDSALKLALEALEQHGYPFFRHEKPYNEAITAIKEALAQPEQEPMAWISTSPARMIHWTTDKPAYGDGWVPLYTTPPQRTWVGLTDEEAMQICVDCGCMSEDWLTLLDAIEAKLKEKNT